MKVLVGIAFVVAVTAGAYAWRQSNELQATRGQLTAANQAMARAKSELASARADGAAVAKELAGVKAEAEKTAIELQRAKEQLSLMYGSRASAIGSAVPITELCAIPEQYTGRQISIRGRIFSHVTFSEPTTHFRLSETNCLVHCVFTTRQLDADARRMLQALRGSEMLLLAGRLIPDHDSPYKGMRTHSGFQFVVSSVARAK